MRDIAKNMRHAAFAPILLAALVSGGIAYAAGGIHTTTYGTQKDLRDAMHGEAYAYLSYISYANAARAHGNLKLAKLFTDTANTENASHFAGHAALMGFVGTESNNLREAIADENYEHTVMYPDMAKRARVQGDLKIADWFDRISVDEGRHRDAFIAELKKTDEHVLR